MWLWRPRSPVICHVQLEPQESRWCNSVWVQRPENQWGRWCKSCSDSKGPTVRSSDVRSRRRSMFQLKQRENSSFLNLFVLFRLPIDWPTPTALVREVLFAHSTNSHANLFQKHPHRHTQSVLQAIWASLSPVKLVHKINHHNALKWIMWALNHSHHFNQHYNLIIIQALMFIMCPP